MKKSKSKPVPKAKLPKNWKTLVMLDTTNENFACEIARDKDGAYVAPIYSKELNDWVAVVVLIEGKVLGCEDEIKVGDRVAFCINRRLWL